MLITKENQELIWVSESEVESKAKQTEDEM